MRLQGHRAPEGAAGESPAPPSVIAREQVPARSVRKNLVTYPWLACRPGYCNILRARAQYRHVYRSKADCLFRLGQHEPTGLSTPRSSKCRNPLTRCFRCQSGISERPPLGRLRPRNPSAALRPLPQSDVPPSLNAKPAHPPLSRRQDAVPALRGNAGKRRCQGIAVFRRAAPCVAGLRLHTGRPCFQ